MANVQVNGFIAEGFEEVRNVFATVAQEEGGHLEAQLAAYHYGRLVVDLWTGEGISADDLFGIYSASKGCAHFILARLIEEKILDLDQRVSFYWPEFAVEGKSALKLRELLSHRAGLVGADDGFTVLELADDRQVAERLGTQRPFWRPGTAFGYHALVIAALTGEVVFRVTGRSIQEHFAEAITQSLGVDIYLGLPKEQEARYRETLPAILTPERSAILASRAMAPDSLTGIAFNRHAPGCPELWQLPNIPEVRALGAASFGGVGTARGLAKMYASAISTVEGRDPFLSPATIAAISQIHSIGYDLVTRDHKAFGAGFHITSEYYPAIGLGSFGHSGAGGQQAFADPRNGVAYGYSRRQFPFPSAAAPENERLINALYHATRAAS